MKVLWTPAPYRVLLGLLIASLLGVNLPTAAHPARSDAGQLPTWEHHPPAAVPIAARPIQFSPVASADYLVWGTRSVALHTQDDPESTLADTYDIYARNLKTNQQLVVTDAAGNQTAPALDGSRVVWQDHSHGDRDILGKNLATGTTFTVASGPADQVSPAIADQTVAWIENAGGVTQIRTKDLKTGTIQTITSLSLSAYTIQSVALSQDYVVWVQQGVRAATEAPLTVQLLAYDRKIGGVQAVTQFAQEGAWAPLAFALDGSRVVWSDGDLKLRDLHTSTEKVLYSGGRITAPFLRGDLVLWTMTTGPSAAGSHIWGLHLADKGPAVLTDGAGDQSGATVSGDQLIWANQGGTADGQLSMASLSAAFAGAPARQQALEQQQAALTGMAAPPQGTAAAPLQTPAAGSSTNSPQYNGTTLKGIHTPASWHIGWYNYTANPPPNSYADFACVDDGGCPALDSLGATQATPFFTAYMILSGDMDWWTTLNRYQTNIRPSSPYGPQVKHAVRQLATLGKRITIRNPLRYPNDVGSTTPDMVAQDVLSIEAWRTWFQNQNIQVDNEPNGDWPPTCSNGCYWPGSRRYYWNDWHDLDFYRAVNDFYSAAWYAINYYRTDANYCNNVDPTRCHNLQTMKVWTPPMAAITYDVNGMPGHSPYIDLEPMVNLYGYFSYHTYPSPHADAYSGLLRNTAWAKFTPNMQTRINNRTLHSQITEFGWDPYDLSACGYNLNAAWNPTNGNLSCSTGDGQTHYFWTDAENFLTSVETHNNEALYPYLIRGGDHNVGTINDGLDVNGGLRTWLYYWQRY